MLRQSHLVRKNSNKSRQPELKRANSSKSCSASPCAESAAPRLNGILVWPNQSGHSKFSKICKLPKLSNRKPPKFCVPPKPSESPKLSRPPELAKLSKLVESCEVSELLELLAISLTNLHYFSVVLDVVRCTAW